MPRRRKRPAGLRRALVAAALLAALAVAAWLLVRGTGARRAGPGRPAAAAEHGDRLRKLATRRGARPDDIAADRSIRKEHGVFVRSWRILLPDARAAGMLAQDLEAEGQRWQAAVTRPPAARGEVARVRLDLGVEAFDVHLAVRPRRAAEATPVPVAPTATARPQPRPGATGRLAILLDDAGQSLDLVPAAVALPQQVAVAVLPFLPHSADTAARMHEAGHEVWLHLPMEPGDYPRDNPGPGAILVSMSESEIRMAVRSALNNVPFIVGVNNHMGSKATADLRTMTWVMQEIGSRGLAFIDSRTTAATVAEDAARAQGIPAGRRRVFLDNSGSPAAIRAQLDEAVYQARLEGQAIAIGHLHPTTVRVLAAELPGLGERGAVLVAPSKLVH